MVNENHFRFDGKTFFNIEKMIYGFKNCKSFSEIELFVIARTFEIRLPKFGIGRSSESRRHRNPATVAGIRPDLAKMAGSNRIWMEPATGPTGFGQNGRNPAGSYRIWRNTTILAGFGQTCSPESDNGDRTLPDSGRCLKIFSRKLFFLKMISSKIFYDGNHFTSKQTEHK